MRSAELVDRDFDARHSARWRAYRYTIVNRPTPDPFLARYAWWVPEPLDLRLLRLGADPFVGEHDFATFCRKGPEGSTTVRRVLESAWHDLGDGVLRYEIRATAFCWQMVRSIVGTLVDVGAGKLRAGDILQLLRARPRRGRPGGAPHGLCLWDVGYDAPTTNLVARGSMSHPFDTCSGGVRVGSVHVVAKAAIDAKRIDRLRDMYADELAGGTLFRGLAEYADDERRAVFLQLADAEERHAEHWARLLREAGVEPSQPRVPFRVRALCFLARHLGTEAVLPLMLRTEAAEADRYRDGRRGHRRDGRSRRRPRAARSRRCRASPQAAASPRSEGRHRADDRRGAARDRVRHERRPGVELLAGDGRRRRHHRQQHRGARRRRRAGCRRVLDGVGRVDLDPVAARAVRERAAHRAEELRAFPEEERDELEMIYRAKGITPEAARRSSTAS